MTSVTWNDLGDMLCKYMGYQHFVSQRTLSFPWSPVSFCATSLQEDKERLLRAQPPILGPTVLSVDTLIFRPNKGLYDPETLR